MTHNWLFTKQIFVMLIQVSYGNRAKTWAIYFIWFYEMVGWDFVYCVEKKYNKNRLKSKSECKSRVFCDACWVSVVQQEQKKMGGWLLTFILQSSESKENERIKLNTLCVFEDFFYLEGRGRWQVNGRWWQGKSIGSWCGLLLYGRWRWIGRWLSFWLFQVISLR